MTDFVLVQLAPTPGRRHALVGRVTIGREDADVTIDDLGASRHHAEITVEGGEISIADLESLNGTFVNDRQVSGRQTLKPGDILRIGHAAWRLAPAGEEPEVAEDPGATRARGDVPAPAPGVEAPRAEPAAAGIPGFGIPRGRPVSAARRGWATIVCFAIVAADAVALAIYFATR